MAVKKEHSPKKLRAMKFSRKRWALYGHLGRLRMATCVINVTNELFVGLEHPGVVAANNAITHVNAIRRHILAEINRLNRLQRTGYDLDDF